MLNSVWVEIFLTAILVLFSFLVFTRRLRAIRREDQNLLAQKVAEVEQDSIRAQLNYHFIFNSLNSIKSLMVNGENDRATDYLDRFALLVRRILDHSDLQFIPIKVELESLKMYVQLEQIRSGNQFEYEIEVAEDLDIEHEEMPAMLLQPFVENAIWHGLVPVKHGGHLLLQFSRLGSKMRVVIEDDGIGREESNRIKRSAAMKRKSRGLKLVDERVKLLNRLHNDATGFEILDLKTFSGQALGTRVEVSIPIMGQ